MNVWHVTGPRLLFNVVLLLGGVLALILIYALVTRSVIPRTDPVRVNNPAGLVGEIIQLEVRNGCGTPGLAGEMTRFLRRRGFDVVETGNFSRFDVEYTFVVDRAGDPATALKVASVLGVSEENVIEDVRPELFLDVSVVIGKDFETLTPFRR